MTFMNETISKVLPIWDACIETPFIKEMQSGTLAIEKFKFYMIQDSIYLKNYARIFGKAIFHSERMKDIKIYYSILSFVTDSEAAVRLNYLKQFDLCEEDIETMLPTSVNQEYINFMMTIAEKGDCREILMAVLPCMLSYTYIFQKIANTPETVRSVYWDFIKDYADEQILKEYREWCNFADEKCRNVDEHEKLKLQSIFEKASQLELDFWNMAYLGQ